jgi:translation elongation factor EF-Ts
VSAGRIETYLHSDAITAQKGGALVKVSCQTDFASRTADFIGFAKQAARMAYAVGATSWSDVIAAFPDIEDDRTVLSKNLREVIEVTDITILTV